MNDDDVTCSEEMPYQRGYFPHPDDFGVCNWHVAFICTKCGRGTRSRPLLCEDCNCASFKRVARRKVISTNSIRGWFRTRTTETFHWEFKELPLPDLSKETTLK